MYACLCKRLYNYICIYAYVCMCACVKHTCFDQYVLAGNTACVAALLDCGASLDARAENDMNALEWAEWRNYTETAQLLRKAMGLSDEMESDDGQIVSVHVCVYLCVCMLWSAQLLRKAMGLSDEMDSDDGQIVSLHACMHACMYVCIYVCICVCALQTAPLLRKAMGLNDEMDSDDGHIVSVRVCMCVCMCICVCVL